MKEEDEKAAEEGGAAGYESKASFADQKPPPRRLPCRNRRRAGEAAQDIWAYEAIPHLGNTCAFVSGKVTVPRCLKWSFQAIRNIHFVHFFKQELVCFVTLEPTDEEQLQAYWASVCTPQPLGVLYALPRTPMQGRKGATAKHHTSAEDTSSDASSAEPLEVSDIDGSIRSAPSRKCTRASMQSSRGINGGLQHVPEGFNEDRSVDRVSGRVVDCLIKPVAEMVTERLMEPSMERLAERLIPQIKQSMEDVFLRAREVYDQPKMWEAEQKLGLSPPRGRESFIMLCILHQPLFKQEYNEEEEKEEAVSAVSFIE